MVRLGLLILLSLICTVFPVKAQQNRELTAADSLVKVSVVTCYPGPEVYQLYGHTAIRVQYLGYDIAYNYGVFDFRAPNFLYRFVKGDAEYMLAAYPFNRFMVDYEFRHSKVVEQKLNIDEEKAHYLLDLLQENAREENRYYKYDYINDNCSTRPRDILEKVIGPKLEYGNPADSTLTFRKIMRGYEHNYPWQSFGIDLALGYGIDKPIDYRQYFFAPIYYEKALAEATYVNGNGQRVPVVSATEILLEGSDQGNILAGTPIWESPMAFALLVLAISLCVTSYSLKHNRIMRGFDALIFSVYGLAGCVIFFLIFVSEHAATSPNLVGLWLNPFYFIPVILLFINRGKKFLYCYQFINFALLLVLTLGGWCLPQHWNVAFYPLIVALIARQLNYIIYYRRNEN